MSAPVIDIKNMVFLRVTERIRSRFFSGLLRTFYSRSCRYFQTCAIHKTNQTQSNDATPIEMASSVFGDNVNSTPVVMLHGFFGSRTNWRSIAKKIAEDMKCRVFTLDARNHGDSPYTVENGYLPMTKDLQHFFHQHNFKKVIIIGHSMGGRTGMLLATRNPSIVEKLVVVDISPFQSPDFVYPSMDRIFPVLHNFLPQLPPGTSLSKARQLLINMFPKNIPKVGMVESVLHNLKEDGDGKIFWKVNLEMDYRSILEPITLSGIYTGPTYFICGKDSVHVKPEEEPAISKYFPKVVFHYIEGAGHAVNLDKPVEFQEFLYKCLGL